MSSRHDSHHASENDIFYLEKSIHGKAHLFLMSAFATRETAWAERARES